MNDRRPRDDDAPETESERRTTNLILLAARRADECMSSGRRNCGPISAPTPPPR
jgi:hypothetical protein